MATTSPSQQRHQPRDVRIKQAIALLGGAGVLQLVVASGPLGFFWTPCFVGIAYLAAALAGGRHGGYWSTTVVFLTFGLTVGVLSESRGLEVRVPAAYIAALGVAAMLGALLQRRGFVIDLMGVGGAIFLAGLFYALDRYWVAVLGRADTYAALIAVVGLWSLIAAVRTSTALA